MDGRRLPLWLYQGLFAELDKETGLNHFKSRNYDGITGRWLAVDPAGQFSSPYVGMGNNPVMMVDPTGEVAFLAVAAVIAKAAAIGAGISGAAYSISAGSSWNWSDFGSALGSGAISGASTALLGPVAGGMLSGGINAGINGGDVGQGIAFGGIGGFISIGSGALNNALGSGGGFIDGFARDALTGGLSGGAQALMTGGDLKSGIIAGAALNGTIGGIRTGVEANKAGANFFTGKKSLDITGGIGAHNIGDDTPSILNAKYKGKYEGVNVFESKELGTYYHSRNEWSGGVTLPGKGIIVGQGVYSRNYDPQLMQHEFGHILQSRRVGTGTFYGIIGKGSLISAAFNHSHNTYWTETWANYLSQQYFGGAYLPTDRFPVQNISWWRQFRLYFSPWQ